MQYIVSTKDPGKNSGGNKAKKDIDFFSKKLPNTDVITLPLFKNKFVRFLFTRYHVSKILNKYSGERYILQYPTQYFFATKSIIKCLKQKKESQIVLLIHDLPGLQFGNGDREIQLLNSVDALIIHNSAMKQWLINKGVNTKMITLGLFDYDNKQPLQKRHYYNHKICFPGNLSKSTFLSKLSLKHTIDIFGPNRANSYPACVKYMGEYTPEELPKHLNEDFGLIWDGKSVNTCNGSFGKYLKFNNPHKISLYLSSGIPVIIWNEAALAPFIVQSGAGITIDSLEKLDDVLDSVSNEEYQSMKSNAEQLAKKLRKGYFIKKAIATLADD